MALPTKWTGENAVTIHLAQWDYFFRRGSVRVPDDTTGKLYPKLSNGEVLALAQAWRRSSRSWPAWYDITLAALGWSQPGDKFQTSNDWIKKQASSMLLLYAWHELLRVAEDLDGAGRDTTTVIVNWTKAAYMSAARDVYDTMKAQTPADAQPFLPPPPPVPTPAPPPTPIVPPVPPPLPEEPIRVPSIPSVSNSTALVFALFVLYMLTRKKGR